MLIILNEKKKFFLKGIKKFFNYNNNNNNLEKMNRSKRKKTYSVATTATTSEAAHTTISSLSLSSSKKEHTVWEKLTNLADFNLKFKSRELETIYFKSYLSVCRLLFIKYLFYVIVFTLAWTVYLIAAESSSSLVVNHNDHRQNLSGTVSKYWQSKNGSHEIGLIYRENATIVKSDARFLIVYIGLMLFVCLLIVAFHIYFELKERTFHRLQKRIAQHELETRIDFKQAESDLKTAMGDVLHKENEYQRLKANLAAMSSQIPKLKSAYVRISYPTALVVVLLLFVLCFLMFLPGNRDLIGQINHFIWFCEALVLLYLMYPFEMLVSLGIGILLSVLFEIFAINQQIQAMATSNNSTSAGSKSISSVYLHSQIIIFVFIKILLHTSIHIMMFYLKLSNQAIKRQTFLKIAHMHKAHLAVKQDEKMTERMIKSIMPPLFLHVFGKPEEFKKSVNCVHQMRPLFIYPVNEISILFADIVGFTRMSSTKTAEELVFLLNDLYGRFDKLCEQTGCEKISTLGDCYYCVSGCLNGRKDHATCCVEMGLLMVKEIEIFNKCHRVSVNMRVGVHTGNALCGFIGGKRFRFDVWSSDVTLANKMESTGRAGSVHISEDTYKLLNASVNRKYRIEDGDKYSGKSTYFVVRESQRETVAALYESSLDNFNQSNQSSPSSPGDAIFIQMHELTQPRDSSQSLLEGDVKSDEELLLLAIRDSQLIQPDVNMFTMRFKPAQESKYQAFLMGLNGASQTNREQTESTSASPLNIWANSQNILFVSFLISFIVNLCVSTGFFLTFIVSSMSSLEYKLTSKYKIDFVLILAIFCVLSLVQLIFLAFNFINCNKKIHRRASTLTTASTMTSITTIPKRASTYTVNNNNHELLLNGDDQNEDVKTAKTAKPIGNRRIRLRYIILHVASFVLLSLIPIFILAIGLPVLCNLIDHSWSAMIRNDTFASRAMNGSNRITHGSNVDIRKRFNLFSMYVYFCYTVLLLQFCSFVQLSSVFKSLLALAYALVFGLISFLGICDNYRDVLAGLKDVNNSSIIIDGEIRSKITFDFYTTLFLKGCTTENLPILIDLGLLILLIYLVNRQLELTQRLSFLNNYNTQSKIAYAREQKELANWLIELEFPEHVVDNVKEKKHYSRNYDCVGVLFVSLCNFAEFFEETYEGGRELLRVLNEITVDFDRLLDEPKYENIEKIKSIGSTYMIASGLRPKDDSEPGRLTDDDSHLTDLVEFALELYEKLDAFNTEAMSVCHFKFQMRMGLNCGPLTSGIIGTERLLYDIWGDTVNVASRMDSTGQAGLIQTTERVVELLKDQYKFTERGKVQIKGKDEMITYFLDPTHSRK